MTEQSLVDYNRIAKAIAYISDNFKEQPSIEELAGVVHLSPTHFKRLFVRWAGCTPKQFLQYTTLNYAKSLLNQTQMSLFDTTLESGLSSTSRLHDLFVKIEGMTPFEYKNGGKNLKISYSFANTLFGQVLIGSTTKGICYMVFYQSASTALCELKAKFPQAHFLEQSNDLHANALAAFQFGSKEHAHIKLHLKATEFQLKVWECLLYIPLAELTTYSSIAQKIGQANASRAVGTAIGNNPISFLIPCHRVIRASGELGGYRWGLTRKIAMIGWEAAKVQDKQK